MYGVCVDGEVAGEGSEELVNGTGTTVGFIAGVRFSEGHGSVIG